MFTVCDERIHACSGGDTHTLKSTSWLCRRLCVGGGGAVTRKGRVRTEGESLMIVSHTTTWLSTLGFVSYSAVTYTKSCFTFQFHTERRSASMPSVRTACREVRGARCVRGVRCEAEGL